MSGHVSNSWYARVDTYSQSRREHAGGDYQIRYNEA
jgi:hypothetical protein